MVQRHWRQRKSRRSYGLVEQHDTTEQHQMMLQPFAPCRVERPIRLDHGSWHFARSEVANDDASTKTMQVSAILASRERAARRNDGKLRYAESEEHPWRR